MVNHFCMDNNKNHQAHQDESIGNRFFLHPTDEGFMEYISDNMSPEEILIVKNNFETFVQNQTDHTRRAEINGLIIALQQIYDLAILKRNNS